jgi:Tfp pilus assembly protein PilF
VRKYCPWLAKASGISFIYGVEDVKSLVYAKAGLEDISRKQLEQMLELSKSQYVDPVFLAISYVGLGEYENAFSCLSKAYEIHSGQMIYLNGYADFFFKELASDPRYNELLLKIGFKVN